MQFNDVDCLEAFVSLGDFKLNHLAIVQGLEPVALNRRVMHKNVSSPLSFDETITFRVVEPLDPTGWHSEFLLASARDIREKNGPLSRKKWPESSEVYEK